LADQTQRFLIVGPAWVGDMVLAQSLFKVLKQRHPDSTLDVLAPRWTLPLLERMPEVDEAIAMDIGHGELRLGERLRLGRELRARGYDRAIVLPNSLKSAIVPYAAHARVRTGFVGELRYGLLNDIRQLDKQKLPRTWTGCRARHRAGRSAAGDSSAADPRADMDKARMALARCRSCRRRRCWACARREHGPPSAGRRNISPTWPRRNCRRREVWLFGSDNDAPGPARSVVMKRCLDLGGKTTLEEDRSAVADRSPW
jgi:heptosyltransferase-2